MNPAKIEPVAIAVFARAPSPGFTKTRLIPLLGASGAARLHQAFILRTLQTAREAGTGPVHLFCAPDCSHPFFRQCREDYGVELQQQVEGDLGGRMFAAFDELCPKGPLLLIGTDCPALNPQHLRQAALELNAGVDAVFLPAEDGGYVLIGLRTAKGFLFNDMPWGGPKVMEITRNRLKINLLSHREPALLWDVDRPEDIERLKSSGLMNDTWEDL